MSGFVMTDWNLPAEIPHLNKVSVNAKGVEGSSGGDDIVGPGGRGKNGPSG